MGYCDDDDFYSYSDRMARRRERTAQELRASGLRDNGYGTWEDPDKPWRTSWHINPDGSKFADM